MKRYLVMLDIEVCVSVRASDTDEAIAAAKEAVSGAGEIIEVRVTDVHEVEGPGQACDAPSNMVAASPNLGTSLRCVRPGRGAVGRHFK